MFNMTFHVCQLETLLNSMLRMSEDVGKGVRNMEFNLSHSLYISQSILYSLSVFLCLILIHSLSLSFNLHNFEFTE